MSDGHERGSQSETWPPTAPPRPRGNRTEVAATQVAAAHTTTAGPLGLGLRSHAQVRTHTRTHAVLLIGDSPASFPLRVMARCACDIGLSDERARAASGGEAPRHLKRHIARAHVPASARKCGCPCSSCGGRLRYSPGAGIPREVACGSHDARAAMGVSARLGAPPCAARNWMLVRPPLPSRPNAQRARCRLPRFLDAPHREHRRTMAVRVTKWPP